MNYTFGKHRLLFIVIGVAVVALASLPFLMSASCLTRPQTLAEQKTLDTMRNMTRNDVLPSEDAVAAIENQFPNTKAAGLARVLRARIKLNATARCQGHSRPDFDLRLCAFHARQRVGANRKGR